MTACCCLRAKKLQNFSESAKKITKKSCERVKNMVNFIKKEQYSFDDLRKVVSILRSKDGCPWDREQTHDSIRRNLLEEAYEACEGIDRDDPALMQEELGDVLLQVVFHTDMEQDAGRFTMEDVTDTVCKKLIFRHPHVFGGISAEEWDYEEIKKQEKGAKTQTQLMDGVAKSLPALIRAEKVQEKAQKGGCKWQSRAEAVACAKAALDRFAETGTTEDLGNALFAAVGAGLEDDAETSLHRACDAFIRAYDLREQAKDVPQSPAELIG